MKTFNLKFISKRTTKIFQLESFKQKVLPWYANTIIFEEKNWRNNFPSINGSHIRRNIKKIFYTCHRFSWELSWQPLNAWAHSGPKLPSLHKMIDQGWRHKPVPGVCSTVHLCQCTLSNPEYLEFFVVSNAIFLYSL